MDKQKHYGEGAFLKHLCQVLALSEQPELIRHNTNLIYDCGDFIARLTPNGVRAREEVLRELHWMSFVGSHSRDVVQVLGDSETDTRQFEFAGEHFTITLLEKIEGEPIGEDEWGASHFERLGNLMGFLHRIGQEYCAPVGMELTEWNRTPEACLADGVPDDERGLPELNQRVFDYMAAMDRRSATYGPIHYDIHPGNYLITPEGRMVLFDFENSCRGHYINDSAVCLYYAKLHKFSKADANFDFEFLSSFWRGYETEYTVPSDEFVHIPWLLLNRSLLVYGYLIKIWPGEKTAEQKTYMSRVEQSICDARAEVEI